MSFLARLRRRDKPRRKTKRRSVWLLRLFAAVVVVLLGAVAIAAVVERSWSAAQLRAVVVLSVTQRTPVLAWAVRVVTDEPLVEETIVGGEPSTVVRPGEGHGPWSAVVFVNGATRAGRHHPKVQRLARGLARAGFLVVVPDLPGLRLGEITQRTSAATVRVALATADRSDVRGHRVAFYGVSVGATLALLAAESPRLSGRVTAVGGEAPWVDLKRIVRLATTGYYDDEPYRTDPYAALAIGRSLAAGLASGKERSRLLARLEAVDDSNPHPLAGLRAERYRGGAGALVALLENREPQRFEKLFARLPSRLRVGVAALSPLLGAGRLPVSVELASAPHDKYFPPAESHALARASRRVHVTVTSTLDHAVPNPSVGDLAALVHFDAFVVRFLRVAGRRVSRATRAQPPRRAPASGPRPMPRQSQRRRIARVLRRMVFVHPRHPRDRGVEVLPRRGVPKPGFRCKPRGFRGANVVLAPFTHFPHSATGRVMKRRRASLGRVLMFLRSP